MFSPCIKDYVSGFRPLVRSSEVEISVYFVRPALSPEIANSICMVTNVNSNMCGRRSPIQPQTLLLAPGCLGALTSPWRLNEAHISEEYIGLRGRQVFITVFGTSEGFD